MAGPRGTPLPEGELTVVFTDIEGSTKLLDRLGPRFDGLLADHHRLLREAWDRHGGIEVNTEGDAFFVVFVDAAAALGACADAQRAVRSHAWPDGVDVRVRIGVHSGAVRVAADDYVGMTIHQAARVSHAANGGQTVVTEATASLVGAAVGPGLGLVDLGPHSLRDFVEPPRLHLLHDDAVDDVLTPLRSPPLRVGNLPPQPTALIGRDAEVDRVVASIRSGARLLTITGPAGVGKTRVGLDAAAGVTAVHPGGAWFVSLTPVADADDVPAAIARALDVGEEAGRSLIEVLTTRLLEERALLLLDNADLVLDGVTDVAGDLLARVPELTVVVTSRSRLRAAAAHEVAIAPLAVPPSGADVDHVASSDAVRLFVERARAANPSFALTGQTSVAVAELCRRLDGIPLAIELAAARVKLFTPDALLHRLATSLDVLGGGVGTEHQRSLRAALEWSYGLLDDEERPVFERLGVFTGAAALDAVEAVCADVGDVVVAVASLVDKSLLGHTSGPDGEPRPFLLGTIRAFAAERLAASGAEAAARDAHARWCLDLAARGEAGVVGPDQDLWLRRLEADHPNLRAAFDHLVAGGDADAACELAASLGRFWGVRAHWTEGRERLERALALADGDGDDDGAADGGDSGADGGGRARVRARAHLAAGYLAELQGELDVAQRHYDGALVAAHAGGDTFDAARALVQLADVHRARRQFADADEAVTEALALMRRVGDERGIAQALTSAAVLAQAQRDIATAREHHAEALGLLRRIGDRRGVAVALNAIGLLARADGNVVAARDHFESALMTAREINDEVTASAALQNMAVLALHQGDATGARTLLEEVLAAARARGDHGRSAVALEVLARVAEQEGDLGAAIAACREALAIRRSLGNRPAQAALLRSLCFLHEDDHPAVADAYAAEFADVAGSPDEVADLLDQLADIADEVGRPDRAVALRALAAASAPSADATVAAPDA